jgi:transcriptional regulator with XRE-family HTH domain
MRNDVLIGPLLKSRRVSLKYSILTVATFCEISDKYLSDVERGKRPPPRYDTLLKMGMYLGINEKDLMWAAARYYLVNKRKKRTV